MQSATIRYVPTSTSCTQPAVRGVAVNAPLTRRPPTVKVVLVELWLPSAAITVMATVCVPGPSTTCATGSVPVLVSGWPSPLKSHW